MSTPVVLVTASTPGPAKGWHLSCTGLAMLWTAAPWLDPVTEPPEVSEQAVAARASGAVAHRAASVRRTRMGFSRSDPSHRVRNEVKQRPRPGATWRHPSGRAAVSAPGAAEEPAA